MGSLHGAYDGISGLNSVPDLDQVLTAGNTSNIPILVKSINNNFNYYVNSATGSDFNDGLTAATAFATIQHAFNVIAGGRFAGDVVINLAAGSYFENIVTSKTLQAATDNDYGPNAIIILGDSANPAAVAINGSGANNTIRHVFTDTVLILDGVTVTGDGSVGSVCVSSTNANVFIRNTNMSGANFCIAMSKNQITIEDTVAGGTYTSTGTAFSVGDEGRLTVVRSLNVNFGATFAFAAGTGATIIMGSGKTYNITGTAAVAAFQASGRATINLGVGNTYNITGITAVGTGYPFRIINGGKLDLPINNVFNITACNAGGYIGQNSTYIQFGTATYNYLGGTPANWDIDDMAYIYSTNNMSGATFTDVSSVNFKTALDYRYPRIVSAYCSGALPGPAFVGFLNQNGTQLLYIPVYVATGNEIISLMAYAARVSNGAGANDLYTVFVNGVATPMVLNVNNATTAFTTANQVALVAGDIVSIGVTSDPVATLAADLMVELTIQKT